MIKIDPLSLSDTRFALPLHSLIFLGPVRHSSGVACGAYLVGGFRSTIPRRTMRAPQFDRIILRSNFTLFFEFEVPLDHFYGKSNRFLVFCDS